MLNPGILLSAIQFVLSADEFSNLRQEERQALLHVSCVACLRYHLGRFSYITRGFIRFVHLSKRVDLGMLFYGKSWLRC